MKSLMLLLQYVLRDLGTWCRTSTVRDYEYIANRVKDEGLSFLTITLSNLGTELQKALDQGYVGHDQFSSLRKTGRLPRLFSGFFDLVFDRASGRLLDDPSVDAIFALRQLMLMWAKIELPCSDERRKAAFTRFIECEQELRENDRNLDPLNRDKFRRLSVLLWGDILSSIDLAVYNGEIVPSHGPGSTADYLLGNSKWNQLEWTTRLEPYFPHMEMLATSWSLALEKLENVRLLEPGDERPVRVITVPKTQKTPRIIAIEPTCMQYVQQGLLAQFEAAIEGDSLANSLISWRSRLPNQELARKGSSDGSLATLDLKEASDRVSNQHVRELLRNHPHLRDAVDACRSRKADVPGHGVIRLAKFASMGSALCFPVEAMVFCTIVFVGIQNSLNRTLTLRDIESLKGQVRVYGDDIIVPIEHVLPVVATLEDFGLLVNANKSFWTGKFRESCGGDYYDSHDVTVVRVRSEIPSDRQHASEIASTVGLRNHLYERGLWSAAQYLDDLLSGLLVHYPVVEETSSLLGRRSFLRHEPERFHPTLHTPLVRGYAVVGRSPASPLDDYGALLKCLTTNSDLPIADVGHLERAGRPRAVDIKPRWSTPY